jgi:hypothetical protein
LNTSDIFSPPPGTTPPGYKYPEEFLAYLVFDRNESDAAGGHTTLEFTWPAELADPYYERFKSLRVASGPRVKGWLPLAFQTQKLSLVHFASDNDRHWFFIADEANAVVIFDYGVEPRVAYRTDHVGFRSFIEEVRRDYRLTPWTTELGIDS